MQRERRFGRGRSTGSDRLRRVQRDRGGRHQRRLRQPAGRVGTGGSSLPPEAEVESSYEIPVATGRYIWVANPDSGRVAYVAGATLQVHTVEAGNAPTYIAPIPSATGDAVVVLNVLSDDATVLRLSASGALTKNTVSGVAHGANALAVSPGGRWVTAWTDARAVTAADPLKGYQAVTLIDLSATPPARTVLSVGFVPWRSPMPPTNRRPSPSPKTVCRSSICRRRRVRV